MSDNANIPFGFTEVTKAQFFKVVGDLDVMPTTRNDFFTFWETKHRSNIGWSVPGWRNPSATPKRYALHNDYFLTSLSAK